MTLKLLVLCLFLCYGASANEPVITKLSTGVYLDPVQIIPYESTATLMYTMEIPSISNLVSRLPILQDQNFTSILKQCHDLDIASLPNYYTKNPTNSLRQKRAIEIIGDFYNWCCGVAKQHSVDVVMQNEQKIDSFLNQVESQVVSEHQFAVSATKVENDHLQKIEKALEELQSVSQTELKTIAEDEEEIDQNIDAINSKLYAMAYSAYHHTITNVWAQTLTDCRRSVLPHFVVSDDLLYTDLKYLSRGLSRKNKELSIPVRTLYKYYDHKLVKCIFTNDSITVALKVPTKSKSSSYKMFHLTALPFLYHNSICQVNIDVDFVAFKSPKPKVLPITSFAEKKCSPLVSPLCQLPRYDTPLHPSSNCLHAILTNSTVESINSHCHLTCVKYIEPRVIALSNVKFAIFAPNSTFELNCENFPEPRNLVVPPIGLFVISLPCKCSLKLDYEIVEPEFPCIDELDDPEYHHLIPAPFTKLETPIISEHTSFSALDEIINHKWHSTIPHTNISEPPLPPATHIPLEIHAAAYTSYASSIVLIVVIIIVLVIGIKLFCCLSPVGRAMALPDAIAIIHTTTDALSMLFLLTLIIIGLIIMSRLRPRAQRTIKPVMKDQETETGRIWLDAVPPKRHNEDWPSKPTLPAMPPRARMELFDAFGTSTKQGPTTSKL